MVIGEWGGAFSFLAVFPEGRGRENSPPRSSVAGGAGVAATWGVLHRTARHLSTLGTSTVYLAIHNLFKHTTMSLAPVHISCLWGFSDVLG